MEHLPWDDFRAGAARDFRIRYSLKMVKRIREVFKDCEIVWLTTWQDFANLHIGPLVGLPELHTLHEDVEGTWNSTIWWKSRAAEAFVMKRGQPFVWIDDDLNHESFGLRWLKQCGLPYFLVSPDTRVGLTPSQLDIADRWVKAVMGYTSLPKGD